MDENTQCRQKRDLGPPPVLSVVASPTVSRSLRPQLGRLRMPAREPEYAPASPTAATAVHPLAQYRLEILGGLTDADVDGFVETGFAEEGSFEMNAEGLWEQTRLEADPAEDEDDGDA